MAGLSKFVLIYIRYPKNIRELIGASSRLEEIDISSEFNSNSNLLMILKTIKYAKGRV
jgi:hypothetical protein